VYDILGQDDAGAWLAANFPNLIYIRAQGVYSWQPSDSWIDQNVQNHGALGKVYPDKAWATEGDTPAVLHVLSNGLHDPGDLKQLGWGGRFSSKCTNCKAMDPVTGQNAWGDYQMYQDDSGSISGSDALHNDFAARMDWTMSGNFGDANHHPVVVLNGDTTRNVLKMSGSGSVQLSAAGTTDPDGNSLSYKWRIDDKAGSGGSVSGSGENATVSVSGGSVHVVVEVTDNGNPSLTAYRRAIIN
jgi:hypothetical protein